MRLFWWALCVLGWLLAPAAGKADQPFVQLIWQRPPSSTCPTQDALEGDVEQLFGQALFTRDEDEAQVIVRGNIRETQAGVQVQIEARARDGALLGTRELSSEASACGALRKTIVFVLIMLVESAPNGVSANATARHEAPPVHGGLSLGLLTNTLPRVTWGFGPTLTVDVATRLSLRLEANYWLPVAVETRTGAGANFHAASAALRACPLLWGTQGAWRISLCAGTQLGALIASSRGLRSHVARARTLLQGLLEARVGHAFRAGILELGVSHVSSFTRPKFWSLRSGGDERLLHRPGSFGVLFSLAFIIRRR